MVRPRTRQFGDTGRAARWLRALTAAGLFCCLAGPWRAGAQEKPLSPEGQTVVDVQVQGQHDTSLSRTAQMIRTRAGRTFSSEVVEEDVRRLNKSRLFLDVRPRYQQVAGGVIVIFQVVERRTIKYVKYLGRYKVWRDKTLADKTGLKVGEALDPFAVEEGRRKLEEFYAERGHNKVQITVLEGDRPEDQGVVYLLHEGPKQKVRSTSFLGNTIASDARLRTQIRSTPPKFFFFKGLVDKREIEEDIERLTDYYRALGFFQARIGRELKWNDSLDRLELTFVIDEGPRFVVRDVRFVGNTRFGTPYLAKDLKLVAGNHFDKAKLDRDVGVIQDIYGGRGYVFADIQAEPRFLEEPGHLDLVYRVEEGARYRVGKITVHVGGDYPHTRQSVVLNRLSLRTGDIADIRELRNSERRLKASSIFLNNPVEGKAPKIVFRLPEDEEEQAEVAEGSPAGDRFRGQSPEPIARYTERPISEPDPATAGFQTLDIEIVDPRTTPPNPPAATMQDPAASPANAVSPSPPPPQPPLRRQHPGNPVAGQAPFVVRGQSPDFRGGASLPSEASPYGSARISAPPAAFNMRRPAGGNWRGSSADRVAQQPGPPVVGGSPWQPGTPQYSAPPPPLPPPTGGAGGGPPWPPVSPSLGSAYPSGGPPTLGEAPPAGYDNAGQLFPEGGYINLDEPAQEVPVDVYVEETQTGRIMLGAGINSNAGLVGQAVIDEQNFDITRIPRSWADWRSGTAFRGAGQQFRLEAMPGTVFQRYSVLFREPYLWNTPVSFSTNGFFFNRQYRDWLEERLGGNVSFGYQFRPDLSGTLTLRGENVGITNPTQPSPQLLSDALGNNSLFSARVALIQDTRDSAFLATEGHRIELAFEQGFGSFDYPKGDIDLRKHFVVRQRPDGSGRHVVTLIGQTGFSGSDTPIYERYFAGGMYSLRGFQFRSVSPRDTGVYVGGRFMMLGSIEYMLPVTADDMLRLVLFCDAGTVENSVTINSENIRVAPGFGLRINVPIMGPAPIALDFAFPVAKTDDDIRQVFNFGIGFTR